MGGILKNKFLLFSIVGGVIVVAIVAYVLLSLSATTKAVVLTSDATAGTTITESMVEEIDVPADTPGDFYKTADSIVGERLTTDIPAGQLIYSSDVLSSVDVSSADTSENFITTMIKVEDDNALGGLLTAGDVVDIAVIPSSGNTQILATALSDYDIDTSYDGGFYYILANVTILDATTAVSSSQGTTLSTATSDEDSSSSSDSSYYLISLSYNDYKKLRIAEQFGELYLNLVPSQNDENDPLLEIMAAQVTGGLSDASVDDTASLLGTDTTNTTDEDSTDETTDEETAEDEATTEEDEEALDEAA